jgi:hypothetical protein
MKKKQPTKLSLHAVTVRHLGARDLARAPGGASLSDFVLETNGELPFKPFPK